MSMAANPKPGCCMCASCVYTSNAPGPSATWRVQVVAGRWCCSRQHAWTGRIGRLAHSHRVWCPRQHFCAPGQAIVYMVVTSGVWGLASAEYAGPFCACLVCLKQSAGHVYVYCSCECLRSPMAPSLIAVLQCCGHTVSVYRLVSSTSGYVLPRTRGSVHQGLQHVLQHQPYRRAPAAGCGPTSLHTFLL